MITVTDAAKKHLLTLAAREGTNLVGIRIAVRGGGCSGLSYDIGFETDSKDGDHVFGEDPRVYCDPKSFRFVDGLVVDVKGSLIGTAFVFRNPNAAETCGCGTSFTAS